MMIKNVLLFAAALTVLISVKCFANQSHEDYINSLGNAAVEYIMTKTRVNLRSTSTNFRSRRNIIRTVGRSEKLIVLQRLRNGAIKVQDKDDNIGYVFNTPSFYGIFNPNATAVNNPGVQNATPEGNFPTGSAGLLLPVCGCTSARCRMTSPFGFRKHPISGRRKLHRGIDIGGENGKTVIRASAKGIVGQAPSCGRGWGKCIKLQHRETLRKPNGQTVNRAGFETQYNHLSKVLVRKGQRVEKGQIIGILGSTGYSTGPHLDFMVLSNNRPVNPMDFLSTGSIENKIYRSGNFKNTVAACPAGIQEQFGSDARSVR